MTLTPADRLSTELCLKVGHRWWPIAEVQRQGSGPVFVRAAGQAFTFRPEKLLPTKPRVRRGAVEA
jgi:hypothetical protein